MVFSMVEKDKKVDIVGFTEYVTTTEFDEYRVENEAAHNKIEEALWGEYGFTGMVKDLKDMKKYINEIKAWVKIIGSASVFITPILTAIIIKYFIG